MKKQILLLASLLAINVMAQNSYDPMRFVGSDLVGTARFVGMGGAMSALGTDISVISTNPAGIGLYRSNDAVVSMGLNTIGNSADFGGFTTKSDKTTFSIDNAGLVLAMNPQLGPVKYVNFAVNYRRRNNLSATFGAMGSLLRQNGNETNLFSQQYALYNSYVNAGDYADYIDYNDYTSFSYPWLGLMTSESALLDSNGNLFYVPENMDNVEGLYPTMMEYYSKEKGGVHEVDLNISANVDDKLYLGLTIGTTSVDYTRYSEYSEFDELGNNYYTIKNDYNVSGGGVNVKFGAIFRPFEYSPLKLGVAVHTPTWYSLTERTAATMICPDGYVIDTRDAYSYGDDLYVDYDYITPWRFNLSASYTFDKFVAVDAEYEYVDYSTAKIEYAGGGEILDMVDEVKENMDAQHIFRVGALFNINDNFSFCCGFNHMTAPFKKEAVKAVTMFTDTKTDFVNSYETNIVTLGAGYRNKNLYLDVAYKLAMQEAEFYNYYDTDFYNPAASVSVNRSSLVFSLGYRF